MTDAIRILKDTNPNAPYRSVAIQGRRILAEADTRDNLMEILVRVLVAK